MEINLNSNGFGSIGMGRGMSETTGIGSGHETTDAAQSSRAKSLHVSNRSSSVKSAGLASAEPVGEVPEEALSRDDELGKLMNAAFNLPPPPMPSFSV